MAISMVFGMSPGELKPPYASSISEEDVRKIYERIRENSALQYRDAMSAQDKIIKLAQKGVSEIEVFGCWEEYCIAQAIALSFLQGVSVKVPKGFTFKHPNPETIPRSARGNLEKLVSHYNTGLGIRRSFKVVDEKDFLRFEVRK